MLGPTTVLLLHVDTYCLETQPSWPLRVSNLVLEIAILTSKNAMGVFFVFFCMEDRMLYWTVNVGL